MSSVPNLAQDQSCHEKGRPARVNAIIRDRTIIAAGLGCVVGSAANAVTFLNDTNTSIDLVSPVNLTGGVIGNAIDLPSVESEDQHNQQTHVWSSGEAINLDLTFDGSYDLQQFHFWNYFTEQFDVDSVGLSYFDGDGAQIGGTTLQPELGPNPSLAETFDIEDVPGVSSVTAILSGTNGQADFQNLGFTGVLAEEGVEPEPEPDMDSQPDPETPPAPIPVPAGFVLLGTALLGGSSLRFISTRARN